MDVFAEIRSACAWVSEGARWVRIHEERLADYAAQLPLEALANTEMDWEHHFRGETADTVAYFLCLAAVNFGSGYFPHLTKRPGMSGYYTIATHLRDRFVDQGPFGVDELCTMRPERLSRIFRQPLQTPAIRELLDHFSRALRQLGRLLGADFQGRCLNLVEAAAGSAERLVGILTRMSYFDDRPLYRGRQIPLFKRAQLAAADLSLAFRGAAPGRFHDLARLTMFADNLVPHVLRMDGLLSYRPGLLARIQSGVQIPAGSPEEVELRACAVHAVELLRAAPAARALDVTAQQLDYLLWHRGQQRLYKSVPRHRTRTIFY
ncbi:MAG: queuosine salvage family protein [Desulfosarcinaceae bacterium]|nr:queuosine salvage family protein [Desulfosarcinaceae bacterium]